MPDKKISEFQTFAGATGSDVFFVIASGETENSNAENYKIPFNDLKSDLGLDAGGGGPVIGGDENNIDFGGTDPGDVRDINFQQGGKNIMVIDQDGDINMQNDLYVSGGISGDSGNFQTLKISDWLIVSGGISGDIISGKNGIFSDFLSSPTGYFEEIIVSGDAHISGDFYVSGTTYINEVIDTTVSGAISGYTGIFNSVTGKKADFSERLTISGLNVLTGTAWQDGTTAGDIYYSAGNVGIGTTNPQFDLDVSGSANVSGVLYVGGVRISGDTNGNLVFG